ncbi:hypothetical protein M3210_15230 [Oceanobacillus luteolus]|uniref:hypothetical protein n=1 Tax=Oceanobacillus luteolus TaxID=1274358 RepID=UPI00204256E5|nr:hypothetical protein [Oceanobacillus luteolus]MCM3741605.1 hypothetical protein [Oceanobacillus luteolus]
MVESIIFGFRDMLKYKRLFILFLISLLLICMIVISASTSLWREINKSTIVGESSERNIVVPISNDMSSNSTFVNKINQTLNKGGKSFFFSEQLSVQTGHPTIVVIDKALNESLDKASQGNTIYVSADIKEEMNLENIDFPEPATFGTENINGFDERIFEFFYRDELVIILLNTSSLAEWIDTEYGLEITELIENINFSESEEKDGLVAEFEAVVEDSFLSFHSDNYQSEEVKFILQYVYPTVGFLILSLIVALTIMYVGLFKKLYRVYTIHLISGATLKHIYIRSSVFLIMIVLICSVILLFLNGFQFNLTLGIGLATLSFVLAIFELILYLVLKRKNVSMTLKGDY